MRLTAQNYQFDSYKTLPIQRFSLFPDNPMARLPTIPYETSPRPPLMA
jgi:hypothetical protein